MQGISFFFPKTDNLSYELDVFLCVCVCVCVCLVQLHEMVDDQIKEIGCRIL